MEKMAVEANLDVVWYGESIVLFGMGDIFNRLEEVENLENAGEDGGMGEAGGEE